MNILFMSLLDFNSFDENNIYCDLLREFIKNGNDVYCISPVERKRDIETHFEENGRLLKLKIGNIQKTNIIEKGISTFLIEHQYINAIKKYFSGIKFDLVLYSTPPITFCKAVEFVKKRDSAKTYLMLKDIFPQNAVDLGIISKTGIKSILYKYFIKKEKKLYSLSDRIGCMSQANVDYVLKHNPEIVPEKVEICQNCIDVQDLHLTEEGRLKTREKYGLPKDKKIFIYGGNLGRPQDIPFIVECIKKCSDMENVYFVIAGSGTDRHFLEKYVEEFKPEHIKLFNQIPKEEYDKMIACCDVGLVFLDHRFTIPNFPSRLLSYMQAGLPVLACTDTNTDIGKIIVDGGFGWWCSSDNIDDFCVVVNECCKIDISRTGIKSFEYLFEHYSVQKIFKTVFSFIDNENE